uniref:ABC1 atypical kinase-like domain-containing protein n=1 Tax=viral metagenome TaxID=1070528 RepID=A0A6C0JH95_9ZZZZ
MFINYKKNFFMLKGGVIFKNEGINMDKFDYILKLIEENTVKLKLISDSTAYANVYELEFIEKTNTPFFGLNETGTDFTVPIYSLILKVVFLEEGIVYKKEFNKFKMNLEEFEKEVHAQNTVYEKTINKGKPVCPSIITSSVLNEETSIKFVDNFYNKDSPEKINTTKQSIHNGTKIGIIVMENEVDFKPVDDFLRIVDKSDNNALIESTGLEIISALMRTLFEAEIFHVDNNYGNILVKYENNDLKVRIIDYGKCFPVLEKRTIAELIQISQSEFKTDILKEYSFSIIKDLFLKYNVDLYSDSSIKKVQDLLKVYDSLPELESIKNYFVDNKFISSKLNKSKKKYRKYKKSKKRRFSVLNKSKRRSIQK